MGTLLLALLLQQREIDAAVKKGVEHLKSSEGPLVLWALVHSDVPDAALKGRFDDVPPSTTSSAAILAMTLEEFDRIKYRARIAHCAQQLLDTQCRDGLWDAGKAVEAPDYPIPPYEPPKKGFGTVFDKPKVRVPKIKMAARTSGGERGDLAQTRWALWGLMAGERAGLIPPAELVEKADAALRKLDGDPAALVSGLCISNYLRSRDSKKDPDVLKAVDRLSAEKRTSPEALYGLRSAMIHFDSETLGGVKWWERDTKLLLESQKPDGSWGDVDATCYAVLTLYYRRWLGIPEHSYRR